MPRRPSYPARYDRDRYVRWHEARFDDDAGLVGRLTALREELKVKAREDLALLGDMLTHLFWYARNEYPFSRRIPVDCASPLVDILARHNPDEYDGLFKPVESILDKLWRKNRAEPETQLRNISSHMTDLVRSEVVATTLDGAHFFSERLAKMGSLIPPDNPGLRDRFDALIDAVEVDSEAKMASGYFAYHACVRFRDGVVVELQVYSELMKTWRKLSHLEYERLRRGGESDVRFGSDQARLVSLGHLLHLAECEFQRLCQERP
jgi:ppGpp synthetase/RelA/SpoT-type nucleotidyltranferase